MVTRFRWVELSWASKTLSYVERVGKSRHLFCHPFYIVGLSNVMICFRLKGLHSGNRICQFFYHPFTEKVQVILSIWIIYPASTVARLERNKIHPFVWMKSLVVLIFISIQTPKIFAKKSTPFLGQTTALKTPDDLVQLFFYEPAKVRLAWIANCRLFVYGFALSPCPF